MLVPLVGYETPYRGSTVLKLDAGNANTMQDNQLELLSITLRRCWPQADFFSFEDIAARLWGSSKFLTAEWHQGDNRYVVYGIKSGSQGYHPPPNCIISCKANQLSTGPPKGTRTCKLPATNGRLRAFRRSATHAVSAECITIVTVTIMRVTCTN